MVMLGANRQVLGSSSRAAALSRAAKRTKQEVTRRKAAEAAVMAGGGSEAERVAAGQAEIQKIKEEKASATYTTPSTTTSPSVSITGRETAGELIVKQRALAQQYGAEYSGTGTLKALAEASVSQRATGIRDNIEQGVSIDPERLRKEVGKAYAENRIRYNPLTGETGYVVPKSFGGGEFGGKGYTGSFAIEKPTTPQLNVSEFKPLPLTQRVKRKVGGAVALAVTKGKTPYPEEIKAYSQTALPALKGTKKGVMESITILSEAERAPSRTAIGKVIVSKLGIAEESLVEKRKASYEEVVTKPSPLSVAKYSGLAIATTGVGIAKFATERPLSTAGTIVAFEGAVAGVTKGASVILPKAATPLGRKIISTGVFVGVTGLGVATQKTREAKIATAIGGAALYVGLVGGAKLTRAALDLRSTRVTAELSTFQETAVIRAAGKVKGRPYEEFTILTDKGKGVGTSVVRYGGKQIYIERGARISTAKYKVGDRLLYTKKFKTPAPGVEPELKSLSQWHETVFSTKGKAAFIEYGKAKFVGEEFAIKGKKRLTTEMDFGVRSKVATKAVATPRVVKESKYDIIADLDKATVSGVLKGRTFEAELPRIVLGKKETVPIDEAFAFVTDTGYVAGRTRAPRVTRVSEPFVYGAGRIVYEEKLISMGKKAGLRLQTERPEQISEVMIKSTKAPTEFKISYTPAYETLKVSESIRTMPLIGYGKPTVGLVSTTPVGRISEVTAPITKISSLARTAAPISLVGESLIERQTFEVAQVSVGTQRSRQSVIQRQVNVMEQVLAQRQAPVSLTRVVQTQMVQQKPVSAVVPTPPIRGFGFVGIPDVPPPPPPKLPFFGLPSIEPLKKRKEKKRKAEFEYAEFYAPSIEAEFFGIRAKKMPSKREYTTGLTLRPIIGGL